jgi:tRNA threonylcarbamoyladenosine biosynthesis protein TsaE
VKNRIVHILSHSREETFGLGEKLSSGLQANDVVSLSGDMGSGKTVLIQGVCQGLGVTDYVTSPTFTLIQEYSGKFPVYHFDFYRLDRLDQIENLGLDLYFESGGIALIEWAERGDLLLPRDAIHIQIDRDLRSEDTRRITIILPETRDSIVLDELSESLCVSEEAESV